MKKIMMPLLLILMLGLILFQGTLNLVIAKKIKIKLAHTAEPTHPYHLAAIKFAKIVNSTSKGKFDILVYPAGQFGNNRQILEQLKFGSIQMAIIPSRYLSEILPEFEVLTLPMAVNDVGSVVRFLIRYKDRLQNKNIRVMSVFAEGLLHVFSKENITTISAFRRLNVRIPNFPYLVDFFENLGAQATVIPYREAFRSYWRGVVNALEMPLKYNSELGTGTFILTGHRLWSAALSINERFFRSYSREHQRILYDAAKEASASQYANRIKIKGEEIDKIKSMSVRIVNLNRDDLRKSANPLYKQFKKQNPEMKIFLDNLIGDSSDPCRSDECKCDDGKCHKETDPCCEKTASQSIL